jgi:hypothetical protein
MWLYPMYRVCEVIAKLDKLKGEKGGWGVADVTPFIGRSRSTVNRWLVKAEKHGWLSCEWIDYRGALARRWSTTPSWHEMDDIPF